LDFVPMAITIARVVGGRRISRQVGEKKLRTAFEVAALPGVRLRWIPYLTARGQRDRPTSDAARRTGTRRSYALGQVMNGRRNDLPALASALVADCAR
jgi:hypothetical protein